MNTSLSDLMVDDMPVPTPAIHRHTPSGLPEALCRRCHPSLNRTPEQFASWDIGERDRVHAVDLGRQHARDIDMVVHKIEDLVRHGEPKHGSAAGKRLIKERKKLAKLKAAGA